MSDFNKELDKFIVDLTKKRPPIPEDFFLFLITEETYIRMHKGNLNIGKNYVDTVVLNPKKLALDRGQILEVFSKMEFLLNELTHLLVIDYSEIKREMFNDVLENVNLHRRIELLRKWRLIPNGECNQLQELKSVRNDFAHAWDNKEIFYKGQCIENNFEEFKTDLKDSWLILVDVYKEQQQKVNLGEIRKLLKINNSEKLD
jgi:hypothetical protein